MRNTPTEERTVASVYRQADDEESGTVPAVAYGALVVYAPDRPPFRYTIARGNVGIGRSAKSGNDLVIESDGQISKKHARIELDAEGRFTLYDLGSTNGSKVNGRRVDNRMLNDEDEITLGTTRLVFQQTTGLPLLSTFHDEDEELRTVPEVKGRPVATVNGAGNGNGTARTYAPPLQSRGRVTTIWAVPAPRRLSAPCAPAPPA